MNKENNASKMLNLSQVCKYLKSHDDYLILTHASPDGDTLGASFALGLSLQKMGKKVNVVCPDKIPDKFRFFTEPFKSDLNEAKTVVAVDVADENLLGSLKDEYSGKINLNIDHHISNGRYAENLYLEENASAACECVFNILKKLSIPFDTTVASALFTGISTDTGSFKYSNVTARTHEIVAELYSYGINASDIARKMFDTKSKNRLELERMSLDTAEFHFDDRCIILTVTTEMLEKTGCTDEDMEGIAVISRSVENVIAGVSVKQRGENLYKISLRTYPPLDASVICKNLGGGGHKNAAACVLNGSLDEVKKMILSEIGKALEESDARNTAD